MEKKERKRATRKGIKDNKKMTERMKEGRKEKKGQADGMLVGHEKEISPWWATLAFQ